MFRQVIMGTWAPAMTPESKAAYVAAIESLRAIPELLAMTYGEDARHFDGNLDVVVVMDFADFESARRYVAHPIHQAYVRDHASTAFRQRFVVQHDWHPPDT